MVENSLRVLLGTEGTMETHCYGERQSTQEKQALSVTRMSFLLFFHRLVRERDPTRALWIDLRPQAEDCARPPARHTGAPWVKEAPCYSPTGGPSRSRLDGGPPTGFARRSRDNQVVRVRATSVQGGDGTPMSVRARVCLDTGEVTLASEFRP